MVDTELIYQVIGDAFNVNTINFKITNLCINIF